MQFINTKARVQYNIAVSQYNIEKKFRTIFQGASIKHIDLHSIENNRNFDGNITFLTFLFNKTIEKCPWKRSSTVEFILHPICNRLIVDTTFQLCEKRANNPFHAEVFAYAFFVFVWNVRCLRSSQNHMACCVYNYKMRHCRFLGNCEGAHTLTQPHTYTAT